ncbi:MAG: hypothetical protein MUC29_09985 [Pyrinomonadaceae bacterium]|jgi:hypothetical protein|nr:hypothetical protein [Pyrinomonadaceae bacterium]
MPNFGLITEGITDQIIIENILAGYFDDPNIVVNPVQPLRDETDKSKMANYGGWTLVFEHCRSEKFQEAFAFNDYVIVQIDTDTCDEIGYDISKTEIGTGRELSSDELIEKVCEKLRDLIGSDVYNEIEDRIIFAIAVHSAECWLLPIYYSDGNKSATKGCLDRLNRILARKENFTISAKDTDYYDDVSRKYLKHKFLMSKYKDNPSLKIFIEEIEKRNIQFED